MNPETQSADIASKPSNTGDEVAKASQTLTGSGAGLWNVREEIQRPTRRVPVIADVDVIVAGGGVGGIIAAIAAARYGARTLIVESCASLGGNMGPAMFVGGSLHLALHNPEAFPNGLGGIPAEFNAQVVAGEARLVGSDYFRDHHSVSYVAVKMLEDAGAEILLSSVVSDVILDGNKVRGLFVENKSGTLAIKSKVIIDCTGTADVAARAGAAVVEQPRNPSAGTFFAIANADWEAYQDLLQARGKRSSEDTEWMNSHICPIPDSFMPWAREAWEAGDFQIVETVDDFATLEVSLKPPHGQPLLVYGRTRINGNFNPGDGLAMSRIAQKERVYIYEFAKFLRAYVPGFEASALHVVAQLTCARGGKSLESVYIVTAEDVARSARFDDVVCIYYDDKRYYPGGCDIPYRMLLPITVDGLLAAGKSAVKRGPQIRQRYCVQLMGQAVGVAAALAVKHGVEPRHIDVRELQEILHTLGSEMGPEERLRELGLV